ncbi:amino acid ABC transporter permease [Neorhizobium sp. NCHU2750]|uniref:amino acid ABC transporter permease n=1 Tax=Neorhizobium sp. NCHU2750 TaxID=1825976 RepID=UPI000E71D894|nr:amino acid ABC transporter permease [Neorhizobium sp. NCHU2750]
MGYNFSFAYVWNFREALLQGLGATLFYTVLSLVFGLALGFVASLLRQYGGRVPAFIATTYVEIFRGTPVLVQLFWFFFCLPALLGVDLDSSLCTVLSLTLYMGAISCESFRAALRTIGQEQHDACIALGMRTMPSILYVVLPQAILRAIPTLLSNVVTVFKESALVSAMGIGDLMYQSQNIADTTGRPVEILTVAALIYFVIAFSLTRMISMFEKRLLWRMAQ